MKGALIFVVLSSFALSSLTTADSAQIAQDEDTLNEAGLDIKRVPHMMLMPYNYPSYASAAASSPYDSTSEDRRRKRTPFYLPSVTGRSSSPRGMRFYKNNWFKRDSTVGSEDEEPESMERERRAVYFIPPASSIYQDTYSKMSKRGIPYYYPVFPYSYRKRYWKRSGNEVDDDISKREDSGSLLMRDLANGDPTDFGWDKKKRGPEEK